MESEKIIEKVKEKYANEIIEANTEVMQPFIRVSKDGLIAVCKFLNYDDELLFDYLMCLSGVDWKENLEVVYHLYSMTYNHKIVLKVNVSKEQPRVPSVSGIWATANWHEREAYDLFGIIFEGHPDLRRILLPEDWEGHPLRKDYVPQKQYKGIDLT